MSNNPPASTYALAAFDGPVGVRMSEFSSDYMSHIEAHLEEDFTHVPDRIMALLRSTDALIQGFEVSQLVHGLQTATMAERAGADIDMIVGALCHDMGKIISNANHPAIAAEQFADDWDQNAFDPDYPTLPLERFKPMVRQVFSRPHAAT